MECRRCHDVRDCDERLVAYARDGSRAAATQPASINQLGTKRIAEQRCNKDVKLAVFRRVLLVHDDEAREREGGGEEEEDEEGGGGGGKGSEEEEAEAGN